MKPQEKYLIDTDANRAFLKEVRESLLSFGHQFPSPGGSSYYLGDDGTPWKDRSRETWVTSRMVHVYSLGTFLGHPNSRELAEAGLKGLRISSAMHMHLSSLPHRARNLQDFRGQRSFWMRRWLCMTFVSGTKKKAYPAIPGIQSSPCSMIIAD